MNYRRRQRAHGSANVEVNDPALARRVGELREGRGNAVLRPAEHTLKPASNGNHVKRSRSKISVTDDRSRNRRSFSHD
jgi:hypothetical protein